MSQAPGPETASAPTTAIDDMFDDPPPLDSASGSPAAAEMVVAQAPGVDVNPAPGAALLGPAARIWAELVSAADMGRRTPPVPLVSGLLYRDSLAWLIGKSGSFKSFVALDIAAAVAGDRPWAGRKVWGGPVLYIVAEGAGGMPLRVRAWEHVNGPMPPALTMLPRAIQIAGPNWPGLIEVAAQLRPAMIVIDTQARSSVGIKENDNAEMGQLIERLEQLKRATGACVWTVHHIGRQGDDARGASALDGAQDTELKIERKHGRSKLAATLKIDKQKDSTDDIEVPIVARVVELGDDPITGEALSSLVTTPDELDDPVDVLPAWRADVVPNQVLILDILREQFSEDGGTAAEVKAIMRERGLRDQKWIRSSFQYAWNSLRKKEMIERVGTSQRWVIVDENATGTIDDRD